MKNGPLAGSWCSRILSASAVYLVSEHEYMNSCTWLVSVSTLVKWSECLWWVWANVWGRVSASEKVWLCGCDWLSFCDWVDVVKHVWAWLSWRCKRAWLGWRCWVYAGVVELTLKSVCGLGWVDVNLSSVCGLGWASAVEWMQPSGSPEWHGWTDVRSNSQRTKNSEARENKIQKRHTTSDLL
jgi:hypothetical protein